MKRKKRVLLGMSGGVDSSVSAILLQKQGFEVIGCTMRLWEPEQEKRETSTSNQSISDAKRVCEELGMLHYVFDFQKEFQCNVIDTFIKEYQHARTPNPCVECNRYLKFGYLYQKAKELECDYIATGHYAKIVYSESYQQYVLRKSEEEKKDQTYFLYTIPKEELPFILFPLQEYITKQDTRKIAEENGLKIAHKKDSQEICFIPDNHYQNFLQEYGNLQSKKGKIVLETGEILGTHRGLIHYTIGQRKGLGIAYKQPLYVIQLDKRHNQVIVGPEEALYTKTLTATDLNWILSKKWLKEEMECYAKIRYRSKEAKAKISFLNTEQDTDRPIDSKTVQVVFDEPQRAMTPGQAVVFYDQDGIVIGGGKIQDTDKKK